MTDEQEAKVFDYIKTLERHIKWSDKWNIIWMTLSFVFLTLWAFKINY